MSTFTKIKAIKDSLSNSESKLASFVLNSSNAIRELSSQELANVVGISQSSVVKFTQKLGYKGYPTFKLAVIDALNNETLSSEQKNDLLHAQITQNDSLEQIATKLLSNKVSVLNETKYLNEEMFIKEAVDLLKSAKRILIFGLGSSSLVGYDFAYKLQKIGFSAIANADSHAQLTLAATFGKDDLVFAISESGQTQEVIKVCQQAKECGASVITLTKYGKTQVSDYADIKLYSVVEDESVLLSPILVRTAQEYIIDILFAAIAQSSRQTKKLLEKTNSIVSKLKN